MNFSNLFKQFKDLRKRDLKNIVDKIKELRESEIKDIRDHLIGEAAVTEIYSKGTQKGFDFEDEVDSELERLASGY